MCATNPGTRRDAINHWECMLIGLRNRDLQALILRNRPPRPANVSAAAPPLGPNCDVLLVPSTAQRMPKGPACISGADSCVC
jgi:hypothetical protein